MKLSTLLLLLVLCSASLFGQKHDKAVYRCMPCGSECDKAEYNAEGKCAHCQMDLVPASTINFKEISPDNICNYISGNPQVILLDVRTKAEYEGTADPNFGRLKGAINIPIQELDQRVGELEKYKDKTILVYCSHSRRSPRASYMLTRHGFNKVVNMSGGMSAVKDSTCKN